MAEQNGNAIGIDLLRQFLSSGGGNGMDLQGLMAQMGADKASQTQSMLNSFGMQSKPMRHVGINGGLIDAMTGDEAQSGLDKFYAANSQLRRGESNAMGNQRRARGYAQQDMLDQTMYEQQLAKNTGATDLMRTMVAGFDPSVKKAKKDLLDTFR